MDAYLKVYKGGAYSKNQYLENLQQRLKSMREISVYGTIFNHIW